MNWRRTQADLRSRTLKNFDAEDADGYDALVGSLSFEDETAYLTDLSRVFSFRSGMRILDAGAGTGTLCKVLSRIEGLRITALEPAPAMIERFKAKSELSDVRVLRVSATQLRIKRTSMRNSLMSSCLANSSTASSIL